MKLLAHIVALAILAMPAAALADDLVVIFYSSPEEVEYSWTAHDVESGLVPMVTLEFSEDEGISVATELETTEDGYVTLSFQIYEVTIKEGRGDLPRVVSRSRLVSAPKIRTLMGEGAHIKTGNPSGYIEVSAVYVMTDDDEAVEE